MQILMSSCYSTTEFTEKQTSVEDLALTYSNKDKNILGCEHYTRNCKLLADCCKKYFTCRFCHDAKSDHTINRYATTQMLCMLCGEAQPATKTCIKCNKDMGCYFCEYCKFWDNDPTKTIYHCPECRLCRIGKGLGIDYFHCKKCNACMHINLSNHVCIENNTLSNCPICNQFMFTSTENVVFMTCHHAIHQKCLSEYTKRNYKCPICSKTILNVSFSTLAATIALNKMPEEFSESKSNILCNDCEEKSQVPYHYIGHECPHCHSFNTNILSTVGLPTFFTVPSNDPNQSEKS